MNPAQVAAVEHKARCLLIVAGPGTGKTHTLTHRIAERSPQLPAGAKILAITFTNKAAAQMQERLAVLTPQLVGQCFVGTFHSFCFSLLQEHRAVAGLPENFRIAGDDELQTLAQELWPQQKRRARVDILDQISLFKSFYPVSSSVPPGYAHYQLALRQRGLLDFDDLISEAIRLLETVPAVLQQVRGRYPEIFVDEYQDINAAQGTLLRMLVGMDGRITAIGDPQQAIYGFRGSDVSYFDNFENDFPGACRVTLSENYRSSPNLLAASSQVMAAGQTAVPELVAKIYREGQLVVHQSPTDKAEAEFVVHTIEKLVGGTSLFSYDSGRVKEEAMDNIGFGDVAILYRLKSLSRALHLALERSGIPFAVAGEVLEAEGEEGDAAEAVCPRREEEVKFPADKVTLMTLHAAKGLEFPVVFIVGCEDQLLPLSLGEMKSDQAEERRLFYVGMTRAKTRLYLLHAQKRMLYGRIYRFPPSPYLADIEDALKKYELSSPLKKKKKNDQLDLFG